MLATGMSTNATAVLAAILVGSGLALAVIGMITRVRTKQRTLAQILDDTIGTHGSVIAGSAPYYYIGPGFAALFTLAAGF